MVLFQLPRGVSHQNRVSVFAVIVTTIVDLTTLASVHIIKRPLTEEDVSVLLRATACFENTPLLEMCLPPTVSCLSICSYVFFLEGASAADCVEMFFHPRQLFQNVQRKMLNDGAAMSRPAGRKTRGRMVTGLDCGPL